MHMSAAMKYPNVALTHITTSNHHHATTYRPRPFSASGLHEY
jgi:hypothetical protein